MVGPDPRYVSIVGDQFRLLCIATGKPDPQITWLFNSGPLDLSRFTITANSLQLAALQVSDEGKYTCVATNTAGNDSIMANLVVQGTCTVSIMHYAVHESIAASTDMYWGPIVCYTEKSVIIPRMEH